MLSTRSSSFRMRSSLLRKFPLSPTQNNFNSLLLSSSSRTYATEEAATKARPDGKLLLTFSTPHETYFNEEPVSMVTLPGMGGDMGVLAQHIPMATQLKPGVIEVQKGESDTSKYFISGGFATILEDSSCAINCLEAHPLDRLDISVAKENSQKYKGILNSSSSEEEKAIAEIAISVYDAMVDAIEK